MGCNYYDGTKLLSLLDINGQKPELYLCTTNRTAGKTTFFGRWFVRRFLDYNEKFALLYRFNYELDDVANQFFKDIKELFFPDHEMESVSQSKGIYHELFLDGESCGYAIALNNADSIKKRSHEFSDVQRILMDEFQSETNHYCPDEMRKFMSIHTSLARGQGKQVRYLPVYMLSNTVSLINPYYSALGISGRLKSDTKFLKGEGYVLEQGYNETASRAQQSSAFNRAFKQADYLAYASQNVYLNDNTAFIERPAGKCRYIATLKYKGKDFAIKEYSQIGYNYVDKKCDGTYPYRISVTTDDHNVNYVMLQKYDDTIHRFRFLFNHGAFRFYDLECKDALMAALSY